MPTNVDFMHWLENIANPAGAEAAAVVAKARNAGTVMEEELAAAMAGTRGAAAGGAAAGPTAWLNRMFAKIPAQGRAAGLAGGLGFGVNLWLDTILSKHREEERMQSMELALEDPEAYKAAVMERMENDAVVSAIEATRMRKLQLGLGVQNPQMLKVLQALASGDAFPRLGPGEHIAGGSSIRDMDVVNRAIAMGDMGEEIDRIRLGG